MTPPMTFLTPGAMPRSRMRVCRPAAAQVRAAARPAGPAPTTITSNRSVGTCCAASTGYSFYLPGARNRATTSGELALGMMLSRRVSRFDLLGGQPAEELLEVALAGQAGHL